MEQKVDIEKRNLFKSILLAVVMAFAIEFSTLERVVFGRAVGDELGLLYSTATGVVLRTILPWPGEQAHLDWLEHNKPSGTTLLRLGKQAVGAGDYDCPNLGTLIPYVRKNHGIDLSYGINCAVVDQNNVVTKIVFCCPVLYQGKLDREGETALGKTLIPHAKADIGHIYNPMTQTFINQLKPGMVL